MNTSLPVRFQNPGYSHSRMRGSNFSNPDSANTDVEWKKSMHMRKSSLPIQSNPQAPTWQQSFGEKSMNKGLTNPEKLLKLLKPAQGKKTDILNSYKNGQNISSVSVLSSISHGDDLKLKLEDKGQSDFLNNKNKQIKQSAYFPSK